MSNVQKQKLGGFQMKHWMEDKCKGASIYKKATEKKGLEARISGFEAKVMKDSGCKDDIGKSESHFSDENT